MRELFNRLNSSECKGRYSKRDEVLKQCQKVFYNWLKRQEYTRFNKNLLVSQFNSEMSDRTRQRAIKDILRGLILEGKIRPTTHDKIGKTFFRLKPLFCCDSGSYGVMMAKNGYKVAYYKQDYDRVQKIPVKKKIATLEINQKPSFDFDFVQKISHKSRSSQRVLTNSPLSVAKCQNRYKINSFEVI